MIFLSINDTLVSNNELINVNELNGTCIFQSGWKTGDPDQMAWIYSVFLKKHKSGFSRTRLKHKQYLLRYGL